MDMKNTTTRRGFIKQVAATGVGLTIGGMSFKATSAKSYAILWVRTNV